MRLLLLFSTLLLSLWVLSSCRSAESVQTALASRYSPVEIDSISSLRWQEAQSYLDKKKYRKAEKALTQVIRIAPSPEAYSDRAYCHLKRKNYEEAHNDLRIAMADSLCDAETYHYCHLLPKVQGLQERSKRRRARVGRFLAQTLFFFAQLYLEKRLEEAEDRRNSEYFKSLYSNGNTNSTTESPVSGSNERRTSRGGEFK